MTKFILLRKRFIENLAFFAVLNLLIKPIYVFGIDRVVQNSVGTTIYGTYFPLFNLVLIFQIFLDLGIENFTRKEIAHNPGLANRLFSSFLIVKLVLISVFILLFSIVGYFMPHDTNEWKLLIMLAINQSLASLILFLRANMGGMHLFKAESMASVLDRIVMILICGTLLILPFTKNHFKIQWFIMAQTVAYCITLLFSLIIVFRKTRNFRVKLHIASYIPILRQLKPYAVLVLLMAIYYRVDSVFLRYLLPDGKEQAGIYAHGFRILDFMSNYALIFSFILLPTFAQMIRKNENIGSLLRLSVLSLLIPSSAILSGIAFYRHEIFQLLYPQSNLVSANVFLILTVSFMGICISYTFGALLTANGNLNSLIKMALITVIISSVLNIILIPKFKVTGAAISNAVSQLFTIMFHVLVTTKKFKLKTDTLLLAKSASFLLFSLLVGYGISTTKINWIAGVVVISGISIIFAIIIKLVNVSYVYNFIKNYVVRKDLLTS
jgi:O-antigen/teichoic acid export membrane protein